MSSAGRAASSSGCVGRPRGHETGLTGSAEQIQHSSPTGSSVMETAEHREPYESRGSRTDLGAPGGAHVKAVCYKRNRSKQQTADDFSDHHEPAEPDDCPGLALALFVPCGKRPGGYSRAWEAGEAQPPSIPGNAAQMNGSGTCTGFAI